MSREFIRAESRIFTCPHCNEQIEIVEFNCCVFRHAVYKHNGEQIPPHSSKEVCDALVRDNLIYGCGKPFEYLGGVLVKCDYK
jgi:hypothetical protein